MAVFNIIKIMLVDDHPLVRDGLRELIEKEKDLSVVAEASGHEDALKGFEEKKPDVAVIDISLKNSQSGLDLVKAARTRFPSVRCLVLSMHDENVYAERALKAGALGYLMKHEAGRTVVDSIRKVAAGEICVSQAVSKKIMINFVSAHKTESGSDGTASLSDRELEVFRLIGEGKKTSDIAHALGLSVSTVETYRSNIKEKLHLKSAAELSHAAVEWAVSGRA